MSDLVGNPEDRFSHNEARFIQLASHATLDLLSGFTTELNPLVTNGFSYPYEMDESTFIECFLAHLSRRLIGELIVNRSSRRPCVRPSVRPSVHIFKHEYFCNQLADWNELLSEASLG